MDATLMQILGYLYDLETENQTFREFIAKNRAVLLAANDEVPGLEDTSPPPAE